MVHQLIYPASLNRATDADGDPVSGAKLNVFEAGTTTPKTVYTTSGLSTAHASPVVADSNGVWPAIFTDGDPLYLTATDTLDVALPGFPVDDVLGDPVTASDAADITFSATSDIASVNVQAAIEEVSEEVRTIARGGTGADNADDARTSLGVIPATDLVAGLVELATTAEVTAGTDTTRYMSVKQIIDRIAADIAAIVYPAATESVSGRVEIATQVEVDAETDDERAVTALKLATYVAAQIAAIPDPTFDLTAAILAKADIGSTALNAMDGDERVLVTLDNDSVRQIAITDLVSKGSSGGAFDLATAPIVHNDTTGVGVATYTFSGAATDNYYVIWGEAPSGGLTVKPSSIVDTGVHFAGPAVGGDTISGSSGASLSFIALSVS